MTANRLGRLTTILLAVAVPVIALVTVVVTLNVTSDDTIAAGSSGPKTANAIDIKDFQFSPDPLVVKVGTTVKVTNSDGTVHTVTASDKSFDTGDLEGGASATITLAKTGTFTYFCNIHNYMTGTIEVR